MTDTFELNIADLAALEAALKQVGDAALRIMQAAMDETLSYLHQELPPYPAGNAGRRPKIYPRAYKRTGQRYLSGFKTLKQQRFFFWAMRAGVLSVPYRRTGTLQREITTRSVAAADGVTGYIGSNLGYAPFVIGDDAQQAPIHQGRWWQLRAEVEKNLNDAARVLEVAVWREINALL